MEPESLRSRKRSKFNDATFKEPVDAGCGQERNDRGYEHGWLDVLLPHETIDLDMQGPRGWGARRRGGGMQGRG